MQRLILAIPLISAFLAPACAAGPQPGTYASSEYHGISGNRFRLSTHAYSNYKPTLLGNGYLSSSTPWNGTSASEATLAGLYDHLEQNSYTYQALLPSWNNFDYWDGSHWLDRLSPAAIHLQGYLQTLDTRRGLLTTRYDWIDGSQRTRVVVQEFLDRQNPHLGVVRIRLTPDYGVSVGPVTFSFSLSGRTGRPFVWEGTTLPGAIPIRSVRADSDRHGFVADSETRDGKIRIAEAVRIAFPSNMPPVHQVNLGFSANLTRPSFHVKFIVHKGQTYTFTKFVAVESSLDSKSPSADAQAVATEAERTGFSTLLEQHEAAWRKLWRTDIVIHGDVEAQRNVHAAMYYLMSELRAGVNWSLPAMALPSRAYLGRVWWDADTWIFPGMLVLHPKLARSIVDYRCQRLTAAEQNAEMQGYRGALFPMESASSGRETAPEWSGEIHETGDVAMAQWRYYQATGNLNWLRRCGYPILSSVANFWVSRVTRDQKNGRYEILHVTGPNEAIVDIDNDSYTNAMARNTMAVATEAARFLEDTPNPDWARIGPKLLIPFDTERHAHLEHSGDAQDKYASALMLMSYPLGMKFPESVKRNDLDACLRNFGKPGYSVGMMGNFYSIVASELGERDLAYKLFLSMIRSYSQSPFETMTETPSNGRAVFLTAEGAFLQQVIFGVTGLRFTNQGLKAAYPPLLPPTWQSLELRDVKSRGITYDIRVTSADKLVMTPTTR